MRMLKIDLLVVRYYAVVLLVINISTGNIYLFIYLFVLYNFNCCWFFVWNDQYWELKKNNFSHLITRLKYVTNWCLLSIIVLVTDLTPEIVTGSAHLCQPNEAQFKCIHLVCVILKKSQLAAKWLSKTYIFSNKV